MGTCGSQSTITPGGIVPNRVQREEIASFGMSVTGKLIYDLPNISLAALKKLLVHVDFSARRSEGKMALLDAAWRWREDKPEHFEAVATRKLLYDMKNTSLEVVEQLLPFVDVNATEKEHRNSILHLAVEKSASCVQAVLKYNPKVDHQNDIHETPLVRAVWGSKLQSARLLLMAKADINVAYKGIGIAHVAATSPDANILEFLKIYAGLDFDQRDLHGRTPLHYVAIYAKPPRPRVVHLSWLIREGLEPMDADNRGELPLHHAVRSGSVKTVKRLLELGNVRQLMQRNLNGQRPIDLTTKGTSMYKMLQGLERRTGWFLTWFDFHTNNRYRLPSQIRTGLYIRFYVICSITLIVVQCIVFMRQWNEYKAIGCALAAGAMGFLYLFVSLKSPGRVKAFNKEINTTTLGGPLSQQPNSDELQSLLWVRDGRSICVTCRHIRPLRSKHCSTLDTCVIRYDHYCPFLANTIGAKNYRFYLLFLIVTIATLPTITTFEIMYMIEHENSTLHILGKIFAGFIIAQVCPLFLWVCMLLSSHMYLLGANLTTNEYVNWMRYKYLITETKNFKNDFDIGILCNLWNGLCESDHLLPPAWLPEENEYREFWPQDVDTNDGPCPICGVILLAPDAQTKKGVCCCCQACARSKR